MRNINTLARKNEKIDIFLDFAEIILFSIFIVIMVFTFLFRIANVEGVSMENTLFNGDKLVMTHLFYTPKDGDIIVINSDKLNETIIKRVIGTANEWVSIDAKNSTVSVNGRILEEDYIKEKDFNCAYLDPENYNEKKDVYEYFVPFGYVFVMGDNRNNSTDSRAIGLISEEDVAGKAVLRIYTQRGKLGWIK